MKPKRLLILVGAPGSGKSYWAKNYLNENPYGAYVSRDEVRFTKLSPSDYYFANEDAVFDEFCNQIRVDLQSDIFDYVIADATHLNQAGRNKLIRGIGAAAQKADRIAVVMETPLTTCLERNAARTGRARVPVSALTKMHNSFTDPEEDDLISYSDIWHIGG